MKKIGIALAFGLASGGLNAQDIKQDFLQIAQDYVRPYDHLCQVKESRHLTLLFAIFQPNALGSAFPPVPDYEVRTYIAMMERKHGDKMPPIVKRQVDEFMKARADIEKARVSLGKVIGDIPLCARN